MFGVTADGRALVDPLGMERLREGVSNERLILGGSTLGRWGMEGLAAKVGGESGA